MRLRRWDYFDVNDSCLSFMRSGVIVKQLLIYDSCHIADARFGDQLL